MGRPPPAQRNRRLGLLGAALLAAAGILALRLARQPGALADLPLCDFVEYWAAGRLAVHGDNPYDPERVHDLERAAGRDRDGLLMWNPPWTLPLVMPFGLLDCRTAHRLWLPLQGAVLVLCADLLWRLYGGPARWRGLAWLTALLFLPTLFSVAVGQITPLVLLGAVGFLWFEGRGAGLRAGAAAALLAVKPHLAYLFWIALLLWAVRGRRWREPLGGLLAGLTATAVACLFNPNVLVQYGTTFMGRPPAQYLSPTIGGGLRLLFGMDRFWLQYLALPLGLAWLVPYWLRHRDRWDWREQLPPLLLASVVTAAYGAWLFDLVLLLVPVMQRAAALARAGQPRPLVLTAAAFLAVNAAALAQLTRGVPYFSFLWMAPVLLVLYLAVHAHLLRPFSCRPHQKYTRPG
jgi:hypothetical protein